MSNLEDIVRARIIEGLVKSVPVQDMNINGKVYTISARYIEAQSEALFDADAKIEENPMLGFTITQELPQPARYESLKEVYEIIADMILAEDIFNAWDNIKDSSSSEPDEIMKYLTNIAVNRIAFKTRRGRGNTEIGPFRAYFGLHPYDSPVVIAPDFKAGGWAIYVKDNFADYFARPR